MNRKLNIAIVSAVLLAAAVSLLAKPKGVNRPHTCDGNLPGAYIATYTDQNGAQLSRAVFTFHDDGTFSLIDSNQGGVAGQFNPFTSASGAWECTGRTTAAVRAIDFSLPGPVAAPPSVVRIDYQVNVHLGMEQIDGTADLTTFGTTEDPLHGVGAPFGKANFTAQRIFVPGS